MQCILDNSIFEEEIYPEDESENPYEIISLNNEQNPENDLIRPNYFNKFNLHEISFLEYKDDKKDFNLFNLKDDIKGDNEPFNGIKKQFPFTYSKEPASKEEEEDNKIKEDELRFGLGPSQLPQKQSFRRAEFNNELKIFNESLEKEFSSKYKKIQYLNKID